MFSAWHKNVFGFDGTYERCPRRMWRVPSLVIVVVLSCMTFACHANRNPSAPTVEFTKVPLAGEGGPDRTDKIEGGVVGAHPGQRIVLFARSGAWWVQPFIDQPFTLIQPDSRWSTTTHLGTQYAALLVDANYLPPASTNFLPSVGHGVIAITVVNGRPVFWQTPWFLFIAMLASAGIVAGYSRYRLRRLANEEARFREALETIPAMTFTTSSDGSNTFVNKRWTEYAGLSVEETSGAGWQRVIHREDLVRHSEKWRACVATGQLFEDEARFRRAADGEYRWFLVRGVPFRDGHENIVKWYGTLTDIEDRKCAEQALQLLSDDLHDSKARLEEAQRIAHVGYWIWDLETNHITWPDETYRIFGLRPQERPIDVAAFQEMIHPDDRELLRRAVQQVQNGEGATELEFRIVRPDGEVRIVQSRGRHDDRSVGKLRERFGTVQDITDRKRAEEDLQVLSRDLQDSKAKLEEAQRITHVGYWERDLLTDRITWSDETYRIFGLQAQECPIDLSGLRQRIHPEDWKCVSQALAEALVGGTRYDIEYRVLRPAGELRVVHSTGDVKKDASGRPTLMFGTVQDITDRKRGEEALRRSEFYLSKGERLAHMGSWAFNPSGFFEHWSQELFKIYGLDPQKGAPTLDHYLATVHPQDRDSMAETIKRMHAEHSGCDVKKRIVRPDGELRYIRCVGIPVLEGEVLKGFLGTAMDITEQELLTQELERRQAHLTEGQKLTHTSSWVWRISDRNAVHLSEEWYRIYDFDPAEGAPAWEKRLERIHPEDRLKWKDTIERAIVEKADYDVEFRILCPNGMVKWIHTVGHPVLSSSGDLEQFVGSSTDITERKQAEEERERLHQLEADLAHVNRVNMLGELAASLAHEIKQPIAAAITSANACLRWLERDPPDLERARTAARRVDRDGNRAADVINRLRSFYRKGTAQRELVEVTEIIGEIIVLLRNEALRHSISIQSEIGADIPRILADGVQLQQVFMNLMLNGIEAMEGSGGELTIKAQLQDSELLFSVTDNGVGLPTKNHDHIFSAFFTTKPQGSGMGLAISRSIVESHGGRLWASANNGQGATFHFTLPIEMRESSLTA